MTASSWSERPESGKRGKQGARAEHSESAGRGRLVDWRRLLDDAIAKAASGSDSLAGDRPGGLVGDCRAAHRSDPSALCDVLGACEEEALLEEQRKLVVQRRQLRDPVELAVKARERGFVPPARVISIPEPALSGFGRQPVAPVLPGVAAAPPNAPEGAEWQ